VGAAARPAVRLLPVQVSNAPSSAPLEVVIADDVRVRFSPGRDMDYVAEPVTALGHNAC
jgi:hypothetical protein